MNLFYGFAVVVVSVCLCNANESNIQEKGRVTILMDDDLLDRSLTIRKGIKYTVEMKSDKWINYKLSVSVTNANCYNDEAISVKSLKEENENGIHDKDDRNTWECRNTDIPVRIFDSSTGSVEISVPEKWEDNSAKLLITAYLVPDSQNDCPSNFMECSDCKKYKSNVDHDEADDNQIDDLLKELINANKNTKRCISKELKCNGRENCPDCNFNEGDTDECKTECPECFWSGFHDTQYMLTILLAGLFFIMSPIVIVLVLFYHKKMNPTAREREARAQRSSAHETISISQSRAVQAQPPPTYDDVHETKTPPPSFWDVVPPQDANQNTNTNVPQGISNNV